MDGSPFNRSGLTRRSPPPTPSIQHPEPRCEHREDPPEIVSTPEIQGWMNSIEQCLQEVCAISSEGKLNTDQKLRISNLCRKVGNGTAQMAVQYQSLKQKALHSYSTIQVLKEKEDLKQQLQDLHQSIRDSFKLQTGPVSFADMVKSSAQNFIQPTKIRSVAIYPTDKGKSSEDTKSLVQKIIKPEEMQLQVRGLRKTRNGGVIISTETKADIEKLKTSTQLTTSGLTMDEPQKRKPRIVIIGVPSTLKENEVFNCLYHQNLSDNLGNMTRERFLADIKLSHKSGKKDAETCNYVVEVTAQIRKAIITQQRVFINWSSCPVRDFTLVTRCYNCQQYGHAAKTFKFQTSTCGHCGELGHTINECTKKAESPKCATCMYFKKPSGHKTGDVDCPAKLMAEKSTVCGDVRGVLRGVFRELGAPLPPTPAPRDAAPHKRPHELPLLKETHWKTKYSSECEKLSVCELTLRQEYARRMALMPRSNLYQICDASERSEPSERSECEPRLKRRDLVPGVRQHATRETSLWVRNIRCSSSEAQSVVPLPRGGQLPSPTQASQPLDDLTLCSLSIGSVRPPMTPQSPPAPPDAPLPDYILCVPPCLEFVNFAVGQEHRQSVRLINVSKAELRLSVTPPARQELHVSVGARGQRVTAGAAAVLHVCFTPRDVRTLHEDLHVRVSAGRALVIPIDCYIQPPVLDVLVPLEPVLSLSCTPETCAVSLYGSTRLTGGQEGGGEVLELGAQLLGDLHRVPLLLHCRAKHAAFFLLPEDSWINYTLDGITSGGAVVSGSFAWTPAWWRGGGSARGTAWCRARSPGLHAAAFRLLCSTAAVRPLCLLADSLHFRRDHITLQAHEKDYDVCSDDDPACEYYVHLGTAFPGRSLTTTVQLINHSPVWYSYYWSVRAWGVCSCRGEYCEGAQRRSLSVQKEVSLVDRTFLGGVRVEPTRGRVAPRSVCTLHVCAPDVGTQLGVQRATLMLILKDIPKESFPPGYDPMVISCETVKSQAMPGLQSEPREVCEVVCCEMEVWWEVAPVRFVLDPPLIRLPHSRRVTEARVTVRGTQLFGHEPIEAEWRLQPGVPHPATAAAVLTPAQSLATEFIIPLPSLPDDVTAHEKFDVIELVSKGEEWRSYCSVSREPDRRALRLGPTVYWHGIVAPGAHVATDLVVHNDTYQNVQWCYRAVRCCGAVAGSAHCEGREPCAQCRTVQWRCRAVRWCGAVAGSAHCEGREPCAQCRVKGCACALLWPTAGRLLHGESESIRFAVYAPKRDGCVLIAVGARRAAAGDRGRAALIAFRVLAPRLVVRALPCVGDHREGRTCECCALDVHANGAVIRPRASLWCGRATCCRLRFTNLTSVPSAITWEPPISNDEPLRIEFWPNEFVVGAYEHIEIQVVLWPERVCTRRVFVRRAHAEHAAAPLYVLVDTDIAGVEVTCEVPLGAGTEPSGMAVVRRVQKEIRPVKVQESPTFQEDEFEAFERQQIEYRKKLFACHCAAIIPPREVQVSPPASTEPRRIQERLRRVPLCLQFERLPLATVRSRTVILNNVSMLPARWSARVRRWPRKRNNTLSADKWAVDVRDPGIVIEVSPTGGMLSPGKGVPLKKTGDTARVLVEVYADCAGLYHDQLLIQMEHVEPIVMDIWVEALGPPLTFPAAPRADAASVLWLSSADEQRTVRARNATRSRLRVTAYLLREHDDERDREPLRLYMRLEDAEPPPPTPLASDDLSWGVPGEVSSTSSSSVFVQMATGVELRIYPDHGLQHQTPYTVEPEICEIEPGADFFWQVSRCGELEDYLSTEAVLMLRCEPLNFAGDNWFRPEPPPQTVHLRLTRRQGRVQLSTKEVRVKVCALYLPYNDVLRVRKRFQVLNVGDGPLNLVASVQGLWSLVSEGPRPADAPACGVGCIMWRQNRTRAEELLLNLLPRSSTEVCVEVCIPTSAAEPLLLEEPATPGGVPRYQVSSISTTPFILRDEVEKHASLKLVLELEYPVVRVQPEVIDFAFVTDGDTRKTYFTVSHSSRTETLDLVVTWRGTADFLLEPTSMRVSPGVECRVYVQYTARWTAAPVEGKAVVAALGREWCGAAVSCRSAPIRDHKTRAQPHDHTDDPVLLPPECSRYC